MKALRLLYHSTLGSRVIKKKKRTCSEAAGTSASRGFAGWNTNSRNMPAQSLASVGTG